jgi:hypothetical protein
VKDNSPFVLAAYARSRDYEKLSRFTKVGGIVLGQPPSRSSQPLTIRDLRWQHEADGQWTLTLTGLDGTDTLGPLDGELIGQALAFAADARPLVVTVINTEVTGLQKIILHPALVNSPLGCEFIELDNFVFSYIDATVRKQNEAAVNVARSTSLLYEMARGERVAAKVKASRYPSLEQSIDQFVAPKQEALQLALADRPSSFEMLQALPEIYDPGLVELMKSCASATELASFRHCIHVSSYSLHPTREQWHYWQQSARPFRPVSAVRDRQFELDPWLRFVQPSPNTLRFFLQAPFRATDSATVQCANTREDGCISDERFVAFEFQDEESPTTRAVESLISENTLAKKIVQDAANFVSIQRLARAALAGQLGSNFPLERLAELADAINTHHVQYETPQWEMHRSLEQSYETWLESSLHALSTADRGSIASLDLSQRLAALRSCIGELNSRDRAHPMTSTEWEHSCGATTLTGDVKYDCSETRDRDPKTPLASCVLNRLNQLAQAGKADFILRDALKIAPSDIAWIGDGPRNCAADFPL